MSNKPHKHAELIKAWADGAEIEYWNNITNKWQKHYFDTPLWDIDTTYRIKPKKVTKKRWFRLYRDGDEVKVSTVDSPSYVDAVAEWPEKNWVGSATGFEFIFIEVEE